MLSPGLLEEVFRQGSVGKSEPNCYDVIKLGLRNV